MTRRHHVEVGVAADTTVTVTRHAATERRPQGLVLDADHTLRVGACEAHRIVLWNTSAPAVVDVATTAAGSLRVWNVWRDGDLTQAWQGEADIAVVDEGESLHLRCSDGHPGPGGDLVVELRFDRAWTQPADE